MAMQQAGKTLKRRRASPGYRQAIVEVLERLFGKRPEVRPGKMFGFPAFYTGGKLFACVYGEGVGLKLPETMVRDLEGKPGIAPFRPYGMARMREWVQITRDRAEAYAADTKLFRASMAYVAESAIHPPGPRVVNPKSRNDKRQPTNDKR